MEVKRERMNGQTIGGPISRFNPCFDGSEARARGKGPGNR